MSEDRITENSHLTSVVTSAPLAPAENATLATRMGSMVIGSPGEFNADDDEWIEYMERLEHFFKANSIEDEDRKKSILLSSCGSKTYKLFRNLLAPMKPGDASWQRLNEKMEVHKNPKPSLIAERFKFIVLAMENQ